jgi:hypothetical protein
MSDWYVLVNGAQQGPISREDLRQRVGNGTIRGDDLVWTEGMTQWSPAASIPELMPPGIAAPYGAPVTPHRGGAILALGIVGLVACFICGIIAWVMGNKDLREMAAGTMDRSGEQLTKAGKICGMIGTIIACCGIGLYFVMALVVLAARSAG